MLIETVLAVMAVCPVGDNIDSVSVHHDQASTIMLNAEEAGKPREINLGLPSSSAGTLVYEDGHLGSYQDYPVYTSDHWAGGNSYDNNSMMPLEQSVLAIGFYGNVLETHSKLGTDGFHGKATVGSSIFGQIKADVNLNGTFGYGWRYTAGGYVNKDPSGTHPPFKLFSYDMEVFKLGLNKSWNNSELSVFYKLSVNRDFPSGSFVGPFYYEGNGKISSFGKFRLGRDNYLPKDDSIELMNLTDGTMFSTRMKDLAYKRIHDVTLNFRHKTDDGWNLDAGVHFLFAPKYSHFSNSQAGISLIADGHTSAGNAVTLPDGTPYSGLMQIRHIGSADLKYYDLISDVTLKKNFDRGHHLVLGFNDCMNVQDCRQMTVCYGHTVEANPERLSVDGRNSWDFNSSALYYDGVSNIAALYACDDWTVCPKVDIKYGLRLSYQHFKVNACVNEDGQTCNSRHSGFFLEDGICQRKDHYRDNVDFGGVAAVNWNIFGKFNLMAEDIYIRYPRQAVHYFTSTVPSRKPVVTNLVRGGLVWGNKWVDLSSMVSYTTRNNISSSLSVSKDVGGVSEVRGYLAEYSIGTFGWTSDATFHYRGFTLHYLLTLQEPKYRDYSCNIEFSDGAAHYDYSGKYLSNTSRCLMEIDPSYDFGPVRIWTSIRFFSRQYANKMNNVWFKSHWETFGGLQWKATRWMDVAMDFTNILCQPGAKGDLNQADTIEDESLLSHYLLAGSYIKPFTMNLSLAFSW